MTWLDALEIVVARTGHVRYRWLCSDDNPDADQRDAYRIQVIAEACGEPPRPSVREALDGLAEMRACPHRDERTDCGCGGLAKCGKGRGVNGLVNHGDCLACLKEKST